MFRRCLVIALLALPVTTLAQEQQDGAPGEGRRQRFGQQGGPGGMMMRGGPGMIDRIARDLDLDETQKAAFDQAIAPLREEMRAMGERWQAVRAAQEAGDDAKATQLREELMRAGAGRGGFNSEAFDAALMQIEPTLRPEQVEKLDEMRDRMDRDREGRDRFRMMRELPDTLKMDEEQRAQFEAISEEARAQFGERMQAMRPLFEEMNAAREAGDDAKVEELRKKMEASRPDMTADTEAFLARVESFLRDDQKQLLADVRDDMGLGAAGAQNGGTVDVKEMFRLAKRLRLHGEQKDQLKELEQEVMRDYREVRRDASAKAALAERTRSELERMLDDEQRARFAQQIERVARRSRNG